MLEQIQAELDRHCSDEYRYVLERGGVGGKIYFLTSNHHDGQLFVIIADDSPELWQAIEEVRHLKSPVPRFSNMEYGGIPYVIAIAMVQCGGLIVGEGYSGCSWYRKRN